MGNRRMFSRRITDSAKFLKMGGGAQLLYFHLCMHADDDGVVEAFTVKRGIGVNDDDMQNLAGRGFIRILDPENEIILITDWYEHNKLRKDRITPSIYRELIYRQAPEIELIEPTQRKDRAKEAQALPDVGESADDGQPNDNHGSTMGQPRDSNGTSHGQPSGNHGTTVGRPKISKDKLSEVKLSEEKKSEEKPKRRTSKPFVPPSLQECRDYYESKGFTFDLEFFFNYFTELKWHDGNGKPVKSWKGKMLTWQHNDDQRRKDDKHKQAAFIQHTAEENEEPWGWD